MTLSSDDVIQEQRRAAFAKLIEAHSQEPDDYDDDEVEENPRPYLSGETRIGRFVCVTQHDEKVFFLPHFFDLEDAQARTWEYVGDDIWAETPVEVYDLDTDTTYRPVWESIQWRSSKEDS